MRKDSVTPKMEPMARGVAQSGVRLANERAVLTLIAVNAGASNADLARLSGLGPQTTSRIVAELEQRGLVIRGQVLRGRRGQPATPLFLNPHGAYAIGVEIGWQHLEVLLFDMAGKTIASVRRSYPWPDARTILAAATAEIATIRAGMSELQRSRLIGIGLASPSFIERYVCRLGAPDEQEALWEGLNLAERIAREAGLPTEWFNDGSAGCWAELIARALPVSPGLAYLRVGTFVGAGIVVEGELWEGRSGNAANLGGIVVSDGAGQPISVHQVASIVALRRQLEEIGQAIPDGNPLNWDWQTLEPVVSHWLDTAGLALAKAVINTRAVIEFDTAVIGGVMPRAIVERLLERVRHHMAGLPSGPSDPPSIDIGHLGASAAATGAAQLVLFRRFFSRAWNLFAA
ncbi:ROK family transcriptional regulator [Devosia lacusdianchii]|jgi:predicted NBD/HSP70 family sugar kinase|uniref:ROK family transcriptional regulator n=1 Tax=Devosia lacusdianchii TaxID=2917991 RepID=UPI001F05EFE2|nr:ROK family transcriptional regulator [Devosia sp. JXJ CY 41]